MIILCADDYGLSDGVSRGILELSEGGRLSATSAMVTFARWPEDAGRLQGVRERIAVGLHLNLTLGQPLTGKAGAAHLDRDGCLLPVGKLIRRCIMRSVRHSELVDECRAQIEAFRDAMGTLPDFIDGHQHVHGLPVLRDALIDAMGAFEWPRAPFVRVPSDTTFLPTGRRRELAKRAAIAALTGGLRGKLQAAGFPVNDSFAGFSSFAIGTDYGKELEAALTGGGRCHLVMCHPGYADAELVAKGDPVVARREEELRAMMALPDLPGRIWHPTREADGTIDWMRTLVA